MNKEPFMKWNFLNVMWVGVCIPLIIAMLSRPFLSHVHRDLVMAISSSALLVLFGVTMIYNKKKHGVCFPGKRSGE